MKIMSIFSIAFVACAAVAAVLEGGTNGLVWAVLAVAFAVLSLHER